ncbi:MAG: MFS transporter, partial [Pigmentiphaga sp.]
TYANPALEKAIQNIRVTVVSDPANCGSLFNPVGTRIYSQPCDLARDFLAKSSVKYSTEAGPAGSPVQLKINDTVIPYTPDFNKNALAALQSAGYPSAATNKDVVKMAHPFDIFRPQVAAVIGLLFILVLFVTMVYGPIAAALVELFPARIRYTSMSLPYHIGNGWFGGLLPATAFAMVAATGDIYYGLWYPIVIALMTFVIGLLFVPETKDRNIDHWH